MTYWDFEVKLSDSSCFYIITHIFSYLGIKFGDFDLFRGSVQSMNPIFKKVLLIQLFSDRNNLVPLSLFKQLDQIYYSVTLFCISESLSMYLCCQCIWYGTGNRSGLKKLWQNYSKEWSRSRSKSQESEARWSVWQCHGYVCHMLQSGSGIKLGRRSEIRRIPIPPG